MLLKSQPHRTGHNSRMRNHTVWQTFPLPSSQRDTKEIMQSLLEKIPSYLFTQRIMTSGVWQPTTLSPPLKTPIELPSRTKGTGERTTLTLARPSAIATATVPICFTLALLATNMPAVNEDHPFLLNLHLRCHDIFLNLYQTKFNFWKRLWTPALELSFTETK